MNQDDIYNLLLILLLMSNERDGEPDSTCRSARGSLNEIMIASMLLSSCNDQTTADLSRNCGRTRDGNTTF